MSNLKCSNKAEKCAHAGESFSQSPQRHFLLLSTSHFVAPSSSAVPAYVHFRSWPLLGIEVAKAMRDEKLFFNFEKQERHLLHLQHGRSTWEDLGHQDRAAQKKNGPAGKCIGPGLKLEAQKKCKFIYCKCECYGVIAPCPLP